MLTPAETQRILTQMLEQVNQAFAERDHRMEAMEKRLDELEAKATVKPGPKPKATKAA